MTPRRRGFLAPLVCLRREERFHRATVSKSFGQKTSSKETATPVFQGSSASGDRLVKNGSDSREFACDVAIKAKRGKPEGDRDKTEHEQAIEDHRLR